MAKKTHENPTHGHGIQANSKATRELEKSIRLNDALHYFLPPQSYPSPPSTK